MRKIQVLSAGKNNLWLMKGFTFESSLLIGRQLMMIRILLKPVIKKVSKTQISIAMKRLFSIRSFLLITSFSLASLISSAQELDRECMNGSTTGQGIINPRVTYLNQLKAQILSGVQDLISNESITNEGGVLSFENIASVISVSQQLEVYDKQYAEAYAKYCDTIVAALWSANVCNSGFDIGQYTEEVYDYLEEVKFTVIDDYASTVFCDELNFQSAFLKIQADEEAYLASEEEPTGDNPVLNQLMEEEMYWPVLNEEWQIELRNPESEVTELTGYARSKLPIIDQWLKRDVGGPSVFQPEDTYDLPEVILFILENWNEIEDLLNWLIDQVGYDCHPSVSTAGERDSRFVPSNMSPDRDRKLIYRVRQKGVLGDFRATLTKIEGKAKLYKKKGNRWKKDHNNMAGIGYCTRQWNPCDEVNWPLSGPHTFAGDHEYKKAKFKHKHPYALTIYDTNHFLSYYLYYNSTFTGEKVYALGPNISCE